MAEDPDLAARVLLLCEPPLVRHVSSAHDAVALFRPMLDGRETEAVAVAALNARGGVIDVAILTTGCVSASLLDVAQVYRWALTRSRPPRFIVLAHNHPSGEVVPSQPDRDVTRAVVVAGKVLGVPLMDHVILTQDDFYSFAQMGAL